MTDSRPMPDESDMRRGPAWRGDRPYTVRLIITCLVIGLVIAIPAGALLYSLNKPLTLQNGDAVWTFGAVAFPLALLVSGVVLAGIGVHTAADHRAPIGACTRSDTVAGARRIRVDRAIGHRVCRWNDRRCDLGFYR